MLQRQAVLIVLPSGACAFAGHAVQFALPAKSMYVSAAHSTHGPPLGPEKPGTHEQFSAWVEVAGDVAFLLQATQLALPALALKEPAAHVAHAPGAPLKPGAHKQSEEETLAGGEIEFGGQAAHPRTVLAVDVSSVFSAREASVKSLSERW